MTPERAKQELENLVQLGKISQQQLENAKFIANSILNRK